MRFFERANEVLGLCTICIRMRWLREALEPGDKDYEETVRVPHGTCFTCAREANEARDDGA